MRRLSRSFFAVVVVFALSTPAFARPTRDDVDPGRNPGSRIIRIVKHLVQTVLDELSVPHP